MIIGTPTLTSSSFTLSLCGLQSISQTIEYFTTASSAQHHLRMSKSSPTFLVHPPAMSLPIRANMDALPLELKQRICSFLTPKELKPLRLTCKVFATTAERYLVDRLVLFAHPESLEKLRSIANHEVFSKHLTTIVYDPTGLRSRCWESSRRHPLKEPHWDDYRPKTLTLDGLEDYGALTTRIMRGACTRFETARAEVRAHRLRLQKLFSYQRTLYGFGTFKAYIKHALKKCPRLRNIVLSSSHSTEVNKARAKAFEVAHSSRWWVPLSMPREPFWDTPVLESLTLIEVALPSYTRLPNVQAMSNLKHLHVRLAEDVYSYGLYELRYVFEGISQLETLSLSAGDCDITAAIKKIRSSSLRVCLVDFDYVQGDVLIDFLLYHANTLERLALGLGATDLGWAPVLCSISCKFPKLRRVQLEALRSRRNRILMRRDAELQAERFVSTGGLKPLIQYTTLASGQYNRCGRGFMTQEESYNELPSGLWPDYENIANEYWDGFTMEHGNTNDGEDAGEEEEDGEGEEEEDGEEEEQDGDEDEDEVEREDGGENEDD